MAHPVGPLADSYELKDLEVSPPRIRAGPELMETHPLIYAVQQLLIRQGLRPGLLRAGVAISTQSDGLELLQ